MKTTHRIAVAVVALALVPAGLTFAAGEVESGTASAGDRLAEVGFNSAGYPIVDTPITVQAMIRGAAHVHYEFDEMTLIVDLQERSNIDLVFETVPGAQVSEKRNLIFASREFPDLMLNMGVSDRNLWGGAQAGDVWALDEMIDIYAPNWKQAFAERPIVRKAITQPDGKIYSLPYYREILNDYGIRDTMAINVDWLAKMGIDKIPDTTEEFYLALKAFGTGIDNGTLPENGVPWLGRFHAWGNGGEWELYNAFGLWMKGQGGGAEKYLSVNDGVVEFGATDPKLRDAVKFLRRLFSEGLITEEFFTNQGTDFTPRSRSVPPISGYWGSYFITAPVEEFYDPLPPLMGPTGVRRYRSQPVRLQKNAFTIFSRFEYPEALVRFIDPWADDTFSIEASYGGPLVKQEADGTRTVTGRGVDWFEHGPHNFFPTYVSKRAADKVNWTGEQGNRDRYIREIYAPHIWPQERHFAYITYTDEEQEELAVNSTEIANYIKTTIANWMVDGGVDDEWEDYLRELDRLGLDQVMEIFQTAYDRFHGN